MGDRMAIFLVNQTKTYKFERDGNYLWAPKLDKNGHRNRGYDLMKDVRKGDFILHNSGGKISAISVVQEDCKSANKPEEIRKAKIDYDWSDDGWIVKTEYYEFDEAIPTSDLREWVKENNTGGSAFQIDGKLLQRYLCNLSILHADYIIETAINLQEEEEVIRVLNLAREKGFEDTKSGTAQGNNREEEEEEKEEVLKKDTNLYRITSLEGFLSLLINKKERFVHPIDCWEDTYEGYMLQLLDTKEGTEKVLYKLFRVFTQNDFQLTIRYYTKLLWARWACYGQCWSLKADSDALWRIYSYDKKAIQIISNPGRIGNTIKESQGNNVTARIGRVEYDIDDITSSLKQVLFDRSMINEPFYHKRKAFEHEGEVRVLVSEKQSTDARYNCEKKISSYCEKHKNSNRHLFTTIIEASRNLDITGDFSHEKYAKAKYLDVNDLSKYIIGIKVHPQAEDWYEDLIRELCKQYSIEFIGKSTLYQSVTL